MCVSQRFEDFKNKSKPHTKESNKGVLESEPLLHIELGVYDAGGWVQELERLLEGCMEDLSPLTLPQHVPYLCSLV